MPKYQITGPDGKAFEVTAPDGATDDEVLAFAQRSFKLAPSAATVPAAKPFGQQMNDFVGEIPRTLGRTARAGVQAVGGMADLVTTPFRGALNLLPGVDIKPGMGRVVADGLNLPKPRPGMESVVDSAAEMVAGSMIPLAAGSAMAKNSSGITQGVGKMLAANPVGQAASAAAAGGAGGYVRETGGDETSQLIASLGAGVAAPFAIGGAQRLSTTLANRLRPPTVAPTRIDITINNALEQSGLKLGDLPADVAKGIRADVAAAFKTSDQVSPDAVRRLADYRLTGATPTAGGLTLDPAIVTRQKNLAKLGINGKDPVGQQLGMTENANNRQMTKGLNALGADTADDAISGGQRIMDGLGSFNNRAKGEIAKLYQEARETGGRSASLDPYAFTQRANNLLDDALLGGKLPSDVRNLLNKAANGEMPLTVDVAEQFKTRIGDLQRATMDLSEKKALGMIRSALDETPLLPGQDIGQASIDAFTAARTMNRKFMKVVEKTPALEAVRDGIEPDKFVQQFIVGAGNKSNAMDVAMLKHTIKDSPEAMDSVRTQIAAFLKQKALNGAADEVGNFSQSAYNKALKQIGDRKLRLFFKPEDVAQMKAIGRVSSYEQFQPAGSAVNNSNTAGAGGAMLLDRIANNPLLSKIPFGAQAIAQPLQNISLGMQAGRVMNVPANLAGAPRLPQYQQGGLLMSPAVLMGNGGETETEEEKQRRLLSTMR